MTFEKISFKCHLFDSFLYHLIEKKMSEINDFLSKKMMIKQKLQKNDN